MTLDEAVALPPGRAFVIKTGLWPGVQRPDPQVASATRSLWLDQNWHLIQYLRAVSPRTPRVLGYLPDKDAGVSANQLIPFDALELALVDAWVPGGNYLLAPDKRLMQGLIDGAADALSAWKRLGRTARWLRSNEALFRQAPLPAVTILVDSDLSREIASLSYRHNVSPALAKGSDPPQPDPSRCRLLAAVAIDKPGAAARQRILSHADAGITVVVDGHDQPAWWRTPELKLVRSDADRNYYALGKGQVVAYKADIEDPGMIALDLIDLLTQKRRPARIWNCNAGLVMATSAPAGAGSALLQVINYSRPSEPPVLARIHGAYRQATLLRPEAAPLELKVSPRAGGSEVEIPGLERVAVVVFK
jgi:hypothetical protein